MRRNEKWPGTVFHRLLDGSIFPDPAQIVPFPSTFRQKHFSDRRKHFLLQTFWPEYFSWSHKNISLSIDIWDGFSFQSILFPLCKSWLLFLADQIWLFSSTHITAKPFIWFVLCFGSNVVKVFLFKRRLIHSISSQNENESTNLKNFVFKIQICITSHYFQLNSNKIVCSNVAPYQVVM